MDSKRLFNFENRSDFISFKEKICSVKYDLNQLREKEVINILDYHILYELHIKSNKIYNMSIRYGFQNLEKDTTQKFMMLPISFYEMERNIDRVQNNILSINKDHFELLKRDKRIKKFKRSFELFKIDKSLNMYQHAIKEFRDAFILNPDKRILNSFKKILYFFYYDKLYVQPYLEILSTLEKDNFISIGKLKKKFQLVNVGPEKETYQSCFSSLLAIRSRMKSDYIDATCYAICLNLNKNISDCYFRFYSSIAPFSSFYGNKTIQGNDPCVIRNYELLALERFIIGNNNYDIDNSLSYIDSLLNDLNKITLSKIILNKLQK